MIFIFVNNDINLQIDKYKPLIYSDHHRCYFHLMPAVGLLNDPNGLIQFNGRYHIFYQWNPFKTEHGTKFWGHYSTVNFVDWTIEPVALHPGEWYDTNGCYSGSAVEHNGKLYLFYTGNVKKSGGRRFTYQCMAVSEDGVHFEKKGPVIHLPKGYTPHFRDPKVWKKDGLWYMVIGAQNDKMEGNVVLYRSENLEDWLFLGSIAGSNMNGLEGFGYMWECPDLFHLHGRDVLLISPQGIKPKGDEFNNMFHSVYLMGKLDYESAVYQHHSFTELDRGFDYYAPQTMEDHQGRRILIAWLGMSDENEKYQPTVKKKWLHMLTIPRELKVMNEKLHQVPIVELDALRVSKLIDSDLKIGQGIAYSWSSADFICSEIRFAFRNGITGKFEMQIRSNLHIMYDSSSSRFTLGRKNMKNGGKEYRHCHLEHLMNIRIYVDSSAVEIFINDGEEVFTARYYADPDENAIMIMSEIELDMKLEIWKLRPFTFSHGAKDFTNPIESNAIGAM